MLRILAFILISVLLLPFTLLGTIGYMIKLFAFNRSKGISGTAYEPYLGRMFMHDAGTRKDDVGRKLIAALPAVNTLIWALVAGPTILAVRVSGYLPSLLRYPAPRPARLMALMSLRTEMFDTTLRDSLDSVEQVVILGAGWDTRAYDLPDCSDHRVFEVDAPATHKAKRAALAEAGVDTSHVTFVAADFNEQSWLEALKAHGFDPTKPTYVLWEGVTMYLEKEAIANTLRSLTRLAHGSVIAFDYFAEELVKGKAPFFFLGRLITASIGLTYGEYIVWGFPMQSQAREKMAQYLSTQGLTLDRFEVLGSLSSGKAPFYGFALAGKKVGE